MDSLFSDFLDTLTPYEPGEQPQDRSYIKLNTNESPYPTSDRVLRAIQQAANGDLRRYPDPKAVKLREAVARYYSIDIDNVFAGNGSDEVLAFAFQAFYKKTKPIVFPEITYSFYPCYCRLFSIEYRTFPVTDTFETDPDLIPEDNGGIVIANPNAPTGACMDVAAIAGILNKHTDSVVLIDEAYIDFGGESCVPLIEKYPNLLVVQTVSKSRALAGLRVGLAMGNPELIAAIFAIKNSFNAYPLDALAIAGGAAAFDDVETFKKNTRRIIETRERVAEQLTALSFYVVPSRSNFLMAQHRDITAKDLYLQLKEKGILVRYFDRPRINNFLRITIGTDDEMKTFIDILTVLVEN